MTATDASEDRGAVDHLTTECKSRVDSIGITVIFCLAALREVNMARAHAVGGIYSSRGWFGILYHSGLLA